MSEDKNELKKMTKEQLKELLSCLTSENEELKKELENSKSLYEKANQTALKVSQMSTAYNLILQDFENFKKRNAQIVENAKTDASINLATQLLPIADNFARAIASIQDENVKNGVAMIYNQIENLLSSMGVEKYESLGCEFDHNLHDAVMMMKSDRENIVINVIQEGYKLGEKIIRPAQVVVGKNE